MYSIIDLKNAQIAALEKEIEELKETKIIRCKDCDYYWDQFEACTHPDSIMHEVKENDFCSRAEEDHSIHGAVAEKNEDGTVTWKPIIGRKGK